MVEEPEQEFVSADGQERLTIHANGAGHYYFVSQYLRVLTGDDDYGDYAEPVAMWVGDERSGLYGSVSEAERAARAQWPWMAGVGARPVS